MAKCARMLEEVTENVSYTSDVLTDYSRSAGSVI
jgi:hypothetical protein